MTNYERLFRDHLKDPQFAKAYHEAELERDLEETLDELKEKIQKNASKEVLLQTIDSMQQRI